MGEIPRISEAEWEVMHVVWDDHPITARAVVERLATLRPWTKRTVKTLLGRLVGKGALEYDVDGREYLYRPAVSRETCVNAESRSFVDRVCGGDASPFLVRMVRDAGLTDADVAELRRILREKGGKR